ncbi:type II toxin-antitoxin system VapB family antitoxin [Streptomyces tailanensis]|uniref:type II toxin-antitoxin system VapB family antitoxin n=1 Tax=Streptomyces tailanensis TaxID=2569858 RepID=UPI00122E46F7|nr:type II toxin-antitoxin system VapB family antitoxin [Streptomyces tailanensis]
MSRTVIDLDDEALAEAARHLGTSTKKDTVNAALREIADRRRRAAAVERMRQMVAEGEIDFSAIDESAAPTSPARPNITEDTEHHAA